MSTDHPPDPAATTETEVEPDLGAERRHLAESRAALARMRERTASLDSSAAGA